MVLPSGGSSSVEDHCEVEALRDTASGLHDLPITSISNRMNEIMKVLTIIGMIFIPLTFVAGVYGMNFEYMPELGWAYPTVWILMTVLAGALLLYFRRREWMKGADCY